MFAKPSLIAAGIAVGLVTLMPGKAEAHRRWLLPSSTVLSGESETVTVGAAASNELFVFDPRPMPLDDLQITGPEGQQVDAEIIGSGAYRSVFDLSLPQQGTYRLALASNGMMGFYELNGERHRWRGTREQLSEIPSEATNVSVSENAYRTETFVTLGAPTETALQPTGVGLEMIPVSHPNDLYVGETAQMRFVLDGEPVAGLEVEFIKGDTRYRDNAGIQTLTTDAEGLVTLSVDAPGMYYLEAAGGNEERRASYTAVLEFLSL